MKRLDVVHHKFIMIFLMVVVFVVGVFLGSNMGLAVDSMMVLLFALAFLNTILIYVVFTQLIHLDDTLKRGKKK